MAAEGDSLAMNVKGSWRHYAHSIIEAKMHAEHSLWANTGAPLIPWTSWPPHTDQWCCPCKWKHKVICAAPFLCRLLHSCCVSYSSSDLCVSVCACVRTTNPVMQNFPSHQSTEAFPSDCTCSLVGWNICKSFVDLEPVKHLLVKTS